MNQQQLDRWINGHSAVIVLGVALTLATEQKISLGILAISSFAYLLWQARNDFNGWPLGGPANWVTGIRLLIIIGLLFFYSTIPKLGLMLLAIGSLALDGIDGWLARKYQTASTVGGYFDKEVDAFFVMILSLILYWQSQAGVWILGMGLIRYVYVVPLLFFKEKEKPEAKTSYGRFIAGIVIMGLCVALGLPLEWNTLLLPCLAALLVYSFGRSFLELVGFI